MMGLERSGEEQCQRDRRERQDGAHVASSVWVATKRAKNDCFFMPFVATRRSE
jgi:hypothetical protein